MEVAPKVGDEDESEPLSEWLKIRDAGNEPEPYPEESETENDSDNDDVGEGSMDDFWLRTRDSDDEDNEDGEPVGSAALSDDFEMVREPLFCLICILADHGG